MRTRPIVALIAVALLTLSACGTDGESAADAGHNDADVSFAQQMIPHHQQAVEMAELAGTRAEGQQVKELAADIEAAQAPEIETMTGWLEAWDEEVPDYGAQGMEGMEGVEGMDHGTMDSGSEGMPGMMTDEDMAELGDGQGAAFDRMWLTMMIEHHRGAIEMARAEQADGENPDVMALAEKIEADQAAEIESMEGLLAP